MFAACFWTLRLLDTLGILSDALGTLLGRSWAPLGSSWDALGHPWGALGALLGALGTLLGHSWARLGRLLDATWMHRDFGSPTWGPKSSQVGSKSFKNRRPKKQLIFKRFVLVFLVFSIDFHFEAKNVDFVQNNVFPRENHDFWSSDFMGQNAFLNSKTFQKIKFFAKKTSKVRVQIHENLSKIRYENLS